MYPTMEEVEAAPLITLCKWVRFLRSPGSEMLEEENFPEILGREAKIMDRIVERWKEAGGTTPSISKQLGW